MFRLTDGSSSWIDRWIGKHIPATASRGKPRSPAQPFNSPVPNLRLAPGCLLGLGTCGGGNYLYHLRNGEKLLNSTKLMGIMYEKNWKDIKSVQCLPRILSSLHKFWIAWYWPPFQTSLRFWHDVDISAGTLQVLFLRWKLSGLIHLAAFTLNSWMFRNIANSAIAVGIPSRKQT